ncbi:hypothetical protein Syun_004029 [Stephania yunnanensis]|uniref:Uncharacterized protein n=1 Tax=Stephania yunnanensis TaxID=152371 RepID=A0AAP0L3S3_9MAGN
MLKHEETENERFKVEMMMCVFDSSSRGRNFTSVCQYARVGSYTGRPFGIPEESHYVTFAWRDGCCLYSCSQGVFGIYQGASNHEELHNLMKATIMIRRLKKHVLSELPVKRRQQGQMECIHGIRAVLIEEEDEREPCWKSLMGSKHGETERERFKLEDTIHHLVRHPVDDLVNDPVDYTTSRDSQSRHSGHSNARSRDDATPHAQSSQG